ncbi:MAG: hypothetical protein JW750_01650 [Anaerolineaceae bacterium]|nr:hypothetical protein [Anaerolineaceae bacterium]
MTNPYNSLDKKALRRQTAMRMGLSTALGITLGAALGHIGFGLIGGIVLGGTMTAIYLQQSSKTN